VVFEFLDPVYVKSKLDMLDISLSSLRDALRGADARTLTDLYNIVNSVFGRLDVALSTRASEATLAAIKSTTDLLTFDANNYLRVNVSATVNPPNLDVALSTRASEATLSALSAKFPSAVALADNLGNPSTTIIGSALLGFDGTNWRRVAVDSSSRLRVNVEVMGNPANLDVPLSSIRDRLPASLTSAGNFRIAILEDTVGLLKDAKIPNPLGVLTNLDVAGTTTNALAVIPQTLPARQPYTIQNIAVSTTEGSTSIASPGAKILIIRNRGDVDVLIGINGAVPTTNPLVVRARTVKVIMHRGVTQVNYRVASGSSTIDIEYYN
jgi:hypothetical protein